MGTLTLLYLATFTVGLDQGWVISQLMGGPYVVDSVYTRFTVMLHAIHRQHGFWTRCTTCNYHRIHFNLAPRPAPVHLTCVGIVKCLRKGGTVLVSHGLCIEDHFPVILVKEGTEKVRGRGWDYGTGLRQAWDYFATLDRVRGFHNSLSSCKNASLKCHLSECSARV